MDEEISAQLKILKEGIRCDLQKSAIQEGNRKHSPLPGRHTGRSG
ncbi:MAG: hypothetical protein ACLRQY_11770 [[Clostridium] leptum]